MVVKPHRFSERRIDALMRGFLSPSEVAQMGDRNVRAILREPGRSHYLNLPEALLEADPSVSKRRAKYVMITEAPLPPFDNVVVVAGISLSEFARRGSPLLLGHDASTGPNCFPLGRMTDLDKTAMFRSKSAMTGVADFVSADFWDAARLTWELVQAGILRAGSIGIDIDDAREPTDEERKRYRIKGPYPLIFTKTTLVEFSIVSLGRDPDAQVKRILNSYTRHVDAMCREGVCNKDMADDFMGRVLGSAVCSRSYHMAGNKGSGWASGIDEDREDQDDLRGKRNKGNHTHRGRNIVFNDDSGGDDGGVEDNVIGAVDVRLDKEDQAVLNELSDTLEKLTARFTAFESRLGTIESSVGDVEGIGELRGVLSALRSELRSLRARQAATEAELREAYSQVRSSISRLERTVTNSRRRDENDEWDDGDDADRSGQRSDRSRSDRSDQETGGRRGRSKNSDIAEPVDFNSLDPEEQLEASLSVLASALESVNNSDNDQHDAKD